MIKHGNLKTKSEFDFMLFFSAYFPIPFPKQTNKNTTFRVRSVAF